MQNKRGYYFIAVLATIIGIYPVIYFLIDRKFGLLSQKPELILENTIWNIAFYAHIILGGIALLIGWMQFHQKFRERNPKRHKQIGKLYVLSVFISSLAGIYIGFFATGGIVASLGFISLGIGWFFATILSFIAIKNKQVEKHKIFMFYSYALCFAAVTLRIWLPLLSFLFGDFITAYKITAWLCWIPNVFLANILIKKSTIIPLKK
jgi:hypothetical protein